MESELNEHNPTTSDNSGSTRLRRRSSVEAPNVSLLLEDKSAGGVEPSNVKSVRAPKLQRQSSIEEMEKNSCKLEPRIEGRIVIINEETLPKLISDRQLWDKNVLTHPIQESVEN